MNSVLRALPRRCSMSFAKRAKALWIFFAVGIGENHAVARFNAAHLVQGISKPPGVAQGVAKAFTSFSAVIGRDVEGKPFYREGFCGSCRLRPEGQQNKGGKCNEQYVGFMHGDYPHLYSTMSVTVMPTGTTSERSLAGNPAERETALMDSRTGWALKDSSALIMMKRSKSGASSS